MLFLLPNTLDSAGHDLTHLPRAVEKHVKELTGLFAESEKEARRYLLQFMDREQMQKIRIELLSEHTEEKEIRSYVSLMKNKEKWGLISDAGLPCLADPGARLVFLARQEGIRVSSLTGPSSIVLSLTMSGFCAQRFSFHGYLPREEKILKKALLSLEKRAYEENATQLWMETPYRSAKMLDICLSCLKPNTLFCVAKNLTMSAEDVQTHFVATWKCKKFRIEKEPCIFLLAPPYRKK